MISHTKPTKTPNKPNQIPKMGWDQFEYQTPTKSHKWASVKDKIQLFSNILPGFHGVLVGFFSQESLQQGGDPLPTDEVLGISTYTVYGWMYIIVYNHHGF